MQFSEDAKKRYLRNILLTEIGISGQKNLQAGRVLIIGVGGLGSPAAMYLASAGVGTIGLADGDRVDLSNLQRQIIHFTSDVGVCKTESASRKLTALNPDIRVRCHTVFVDAKSIAAILEDYDFVLDCTDDADTKFLINDACVKAQTPFCHAGISRFSGHIMTVLPGKSPCLRCVFPEPPKAADKAPEQTGVIGALVGVIGSLQAMEAIKYLTGAGELLAGYLLKYNALTADFRKIRLIERADGCSVCRHVPISSF